MGPGRATEQPPRNTSQRPDHMKLLVGSAGSAAPGLESRTPALARRSAARAIILDVQPAALECSAHHQTAHRAARCQVAVKAVADRHPGSWRAARVGFPLFDDGDCQRRAASGGPSYVLARAGRRLGVEQHRDAVVLTLVEHVRRSQHTLPGGDAPILVDGHSHEILRTRSAIEKAHQVTGSSYTP
jgi:hypothetical protein